MAQTVIGGTASPKVEERAMEPAYKHSIIESSYTPHTSLLSFIPGEPTLVEWYRGSYGNDEEQHAFEPDSIQTYASYKRVNNLIVKIDTPKNYAFDLVKGQGADTISGYVLFDLVPNRGDLLIKDIGDGRAGLYYVYEQPEPKTINADKCYYFEARLTGIVTKVIMDNLNSKVIEELYYQKDIAVAGGNAVLTKEDVDLNKKIYEGRLAIIDDILANHFLSDEDTIIIPNEDNDWLYDPYLAKFLAYTIPTNLLGMRRKIKLLDVNYYVDNRKLQEPITIWDMFYKGAFDHPERFKQDFYVHNREDLLNTRFYGSVFFSKMDRVITIHKESAMKAPYKYNGSLFPVGPSVGMPEPEGKPWNYFFTPEFYEGKGTELESFVWKMWKEKTIDKKALVEALDGYWKLSDKEKLYMGGIYVGACKTALKKSSSYT